MRKARYISFVLVAFMLLSMSTIAFSSAATVNTNQQPAQYNHYMTSVLIDRYSGWLLYNRVPELRTAYDLNALYAAGYDGSGKTVVIVDAFGSPTIYEDLMLFDQWQDARGANLPWTNMTDVQKHLTIYYPQGQPVFDPTDGNQLGWSQEVTLDVCMVHAIAPGANIALVIAPNNNLVPLNYAVNYAIVNRLGCAISLSWGSPEYEITAPADIASLYQAHWMYMRAAFEGITVFASAGDWGATNGDPQNNALNPASDPFVTAVGGTNLFMTCNNGAYKEGTGNFLNAPYPAIGTSYYYEIAGNDYEAMVADGNPYAMDMVTTGGAMSTFFQTPWWQWGIRLTSADGTSIRPTGRCTSDVSFDSGVYGGIGAVPWSADAEGITYYYIFGGTSAGSPFWAALTAIACQYAHHNLGYINPMLYLMRCYLYYKGAFHDITLGDNTWPTGNVPVGYQATRGWDAPTGIGSPDAANLVPLMQWW